MGKRKRREKTESIDAAPLVPGSKCSKRQSCDSEAHKIRSVLSKQQNKLDSGAFQIYLENIWRSLSEDKRTSFIYLDSLWFSLYTRDLSRENVLTWIKRKHIFSKKYVFVPIVCWNHWSLLIFCHFGESLESETRSPCMLLLDSLDKVNPRRLEPNIRKFVMDIFIAEGRAEDKDMAYQIPFMVPEVPQQRNGEECGRFVLYYINLFAQAAPENFSIYEGYPYFMKRNWFSNESFDHFCEKLDSDGNSCE